MFRLVGTRGVLPTEAQAYLGPHAYSHAVFALRVRGDGGKAQHCMVAAPGLWMTQASLRRVLPESNYAMEDPIAAGVVW